MRCLIMSQIPSFKPNLKIFYHLEMFVDEFIGKIKFSHILAEIITI